MISEADAREAARHLAVCRERLSKLDKEDVEFKFIARDMDNHAWRLACFAVDELARREAERVERAKPIDAEWCRTHGGQGSDDQMSWQVTGGEWVRITLYKPHGSSTTLMGRKLYDIQTVGDLSDLLSALKGGV